MQGEHATLVVIEYGALWPRWLDPSRLGDIAVVAQHYEGPPHSIVTQFENRLTRLVASQWKIDNAFLVSNGRTDLESLGARSILARGLLAQLKKSAGHRLVLAVSPGRGERACKTLSSLAETLGPSALEAGLELVLATTETESGPAARALLASEPGPDIDDEATRVMPGFDPNAVPLLKLGAAC
jgi:hypothetical protein